MRASLPEITTLSKEEVFILLDQLLLKGGPEPEEYKELNHVLDHLPALLKAKEIEESELREMIEKCSFLKSTDSIMGHIRQKPFGYAGDYAIIDRIYLKEVSEEFRKWDDFSVNHLAAEAVRNRKGFFLKLMQAKLSRTEAPLRLLNVASGPARDLCQLYSHIKAESLQATCVEYDKRAITHAQQVCDHYLKHISFINENIFRFDTEEQYEVVWSAGLFDYFDNKTFVRVLRKLIKWTAPGGEVIVGNFSDDNPSRAYMEIFGDWHLQHRSPGELKLLALEAGALPAQITVDTEPLGINLFLRIRKP
ncbi:class I SAM-dependent methyltransferase [Nafulsella turpanensis]|uniref:class I SAM-dependent methyltransferase n=1 Tax=Nafulsella turpanensis TaxID=1265690 RepID=UPI00034879DF|nr:class I SAM-dependent methyltransferase [Nafulsella turpanensis]